ncbi:MAG: single-stranded DNA-binding protein [Actinomycetes bacterium]
MEATIQMTGNVGSDVDYRNNTAPVASFRLAHTPREKHGTEWSDGTTTWLTVKAFYGLAENLAASLKKGDPVVVAGKLRTVAWEKDGVSQSRIELVADTVGHDLRRGAARFVRSAKSPTGEGDESVASGSAEAEDGGEAAETRAA